MTGPSHRSAGPSLGHLLRLGRKGPSPIVVTQTIQDFSGFRGEGADFLDIISGGPTPKGVWVDLEPPDTEGGFLASGSVLMALMMLRQSLTGVPCDPDQKRGRDDATEVLRGRVTERLFRNWSPAPAVTKHRVFRALDGTLRAEDDATRLMYLVLIGAITEITSDTENVVRACHRGWVPARHRFRVILTDYLQATFGPSLSSFPEDHAQRMVHEAAREIYTAAWRTRLRMVEDMIRSTVPEGTDWTPPRWAT